jgi:hypothetical protein
VAKAAATRKLEVTEMADESENRENLEDIREKAISLRDQIATELKKLPAFSLAQIEQMTNFTALQDFAEACERALDQIDADMDD